MVWICPNAPTRRWLDHAGRMVSGVWRCRAYEHIQPPYIALSLHSSASFRGSGDPPRKRGQGQKTLKSQCLKIVAELLILVLAIFAMLAPLFVLARACANGVGALPPKQNRPQGCGLFFSASSKNFVSAPRSPPLALRGFRWTLQPTFGGTHFAIVEVNYFFKFWLFSFIDLLFLDERVIYFYDCDWQYLYCYCSL